MTIKITAQDISMRFKERGLFHIPTLSIGPNDASTSKATTGLEKRRYSKFCLVWRSPQLGTSTPPMILGLSDFLAEQEEKTSSICTNRLICLMARFIKTSSMASDTNKNHLKLSELKLLLRYAW